MLSNQLDDLWGEERVRLLQVPHGLQLRVAFGFPLRDFLEPIGHGKVVPGEASLCRFLDREVVHACVELLSPLRRESLERERLEIVGRGNRRDRAASKGSGSDGVGGREHGGGITKHEFFNVDRHDC